MVHTARLRHDSLAAPSSRNVPAKWLAAAAFAAIGLLAAPAAQAQEAPPAPVVTVAKPLVRDIVEDDEFVGRFEAVDEVSLRSRVGGYLDQVHFQDGAIVKQGDLLFTIDQRPFKAALTQAQVAGRRRTKPCSTSARCSSSAPRPCRAKATFRFRH